MSSTPIVLNKDYKEQYLRLLHKKGYPPTFKQMVGFNKRFYNDLGLQGEKRAAVIELVQAFNMSIKRNIEPRFVKNKPELKKMFSAVVADCRKKYGKAVPPIRKGTPVKYRAASEPTSKASAHDDETSSHMKDAQEEEEEEAADSDLEPEPLKEQLMEKGQKIKDLEKEVAEQKKMVADLETKNVEIAKALMAKEGVIRKLKTVEKTAQAKESEVARLGDELNLKNYQLAMVQTEAANQGQAKQTLEEEKRYLESTVLSMEEKNSWLEDKVRLMEGAKQALEDEKRSLEKKNRCLEERNREETVHSLKETLHEKDQMLKTFLKMQETIQSLTNKPAPQ